MELVVEGTPRESGVTVELITSAANWMLELLMSEDMSRFNDIKLEVDVVDDILESHGYAAESNWLDDRLRPSSFYIDIDSHMSEKSMLITLGHELVHVKQMAFGQRQESLDGRAMRWMGMLIRPDEMDYYDLPWEVEAWGREYGLWDRFIQHRSGLIVPKTSIITTIDPSQRMRLVK